jgi:hypothetical protein
LSSYFLRQLPRLFPRMDGQFVSPLLKPIQQGPQHRPVAFVRAATPITLAPPRPIGCGLLGRGSRRDRRGAAALASELLSRDASRVQRWFGRYHQLDWRHGRDGQTFARGKLLHCEIFQALKVSIIQGRALILAGSSLPTSHPAGRCPHHCPTFGTGELQEGGTTL